MQSDYTYALIVMLKHIKEKIIGMQPPFDNAKYFNAWGYSGRWFLDKQREYKTSFKRNRKVN